MTDDVNLNRLEEQFGNPQWGASALSRIALLKPFEERQRQELYQLGRVLHVKPDTNIVVEGEMSRGLYFLLFGLVSVYKTDRVGGQMVRLANLHQWDVFGELSLIDDSPRSATVVAAQGSYLFELSAEKFHTYLESQGSDAQVAFYRQCTWELVRRIRALNEDYVLAQRMLWEYRHQMKQQAKHEAPQTFRREPEK
ncbi:MAG: cyclic nucleotide-binding domain-containing protein [Zetaproteobacteria bacterium]|nr:cyclic nucleotide-binding domain-containing protein [Zetaproteobacteria bacterium]